jgi:hypothetical protein
VAPFSLEKDMNLEKVKQDLWVKNSKSGNTKYDKLRDFMRTLEVGDSFFLNLDEFIEVSGGRVEGKTEQQYYSRLIATVKRLAKDLDYNVQMRIHREGEPAGYWTFRV